jgi:GWxTD domain-containing protein
VLPLCTSFFLSSAFCLVLLPIAANEPLIALRRASDGPGLTATAKATQAKGKRENNEKLQARLVAHLPRAFRKWLTEEAVYIILPEERAAFLELTTDTQREEFIQQFWLRRDPSPGTFENEYKEEHYRRIQFANMHFSAGVDGWRTDRGLVYVLYGPPDSRSIHEGTWYSPEDRDDETLAYSLYLSKRLAPVYAFQKWRYKYIDGIGMNVTLEFVDRNGTGSFDLADDPGEKYEVLPVPGGVFDVVTMGLLSESVKLPPRLVMDMRTRQLERMMRQAKAMAPATDRASEEKKKYEELITVRLLRDTLAVQSHFDTFLDAKMGHQVALTLAFKSRDLRFEPREGRFRATVNVRGFVTTVTGMTVLRFARAVQWELSDASPGEGVTLFYQKLLEIAPGHYILHLESLEPTSKSGARWDLPIEVPDYSNGKLAVSSLVLATRLERVDQNLLRNRPFVVNDVKVYPSMDGTIPGDGQIRIFFQIYNLDVDSKTKKPHATVEYLILSGEQVIFRHTETATEFSQPGNQLTLATKFPLSTMIPGNYNLRVKVSDQVSQQSVEAQGTFRVLAP